MKVKNVSKQMSSTINSIDSMVPEKSKTKAYLVGNEWLTVVSEIAEGYYISISNDKDKNIRPTHADVDSIGRTGIFPYQSYYYMSFPSSNTAHINLMTSKKHMAK